MSAIDLFNLAGNKKPAEAGFLLRIFHLTDD